MSNKIKQELEKIGVSLEIDNSARLGVEKAKAKIEQNRGFQMEKENIRKHLDNVIEKQVPDVWNEIEDKIKKSEEPSI